ncbi:MAG: alkaline phosphatase D family protein, partial [Candidatus Scalindua sp.]
MLDSNGNPDLTNPKRTAYFRLHREYDRTGTFNLGKDVGLGEDEISKPFTLKPGTYYKVRMGTLALDDSFANDESLSDEEIVRRLPAPTVWAKELASLDPNTAEAVFRTDIEGNADKLSFLIGSCRYPGLLWGKKNADKIFKPILDHLSNNPYGEDPKFILMVGDQIYADMLNRLVPIGLADTYEEFQDRYHQAFGSRNMRRLLRNIPTYMILDDHEIEDNWTQDRIGKSSKKRLIFNLAMGAYMSYQWSHGPRNYADRLFYNFEHAGFPFFTIDVRTQRFKDAEFGLKDNHLLGRPSFDPINEPTQLNHLCNWLSDQQEKNGNRPKFITSSSVFVPNQVITVKSDKQKDNSDSWSAFPQTRKTLLKHIVDNNIQNVVFLSGDIHNSNVAEIDFSGNTSAKNLKAFSITSSAFYWPFSFADGEPSNYVHDSKKQGDTFTIDEETGVNMDYKARSFTQKDNFCQVNINWPKKELKVRAIDQKGNL